MLKSHFQGGKMETLKRLMVSGLMLALLGGLAVQAQARVTEKVEGMIAENSPLKVNDNDLWIQIGYPLVAGLQYDKYATANLALGGGIGSFMNGFSLDLSAKYYFLEGKFSPFLAAGPVLYYSSSDQNIFAVFGTAGIGYFFGSGMGLSLAGTYCQAITKSDKAWGYPWVNDKLAQPSVQFGFHLIY
jgi:hypothetical protein